MLDLATLPLSLHKETAGSGLSRLDILRAKYSTTNTTTGFLPEITGGLPGEQSQSVPDDSYS